MGNDRRLPALLGVVLISLAALWSSQAGAAEGTVLQAVNVDNLPGNRVQIRFQLSQPLAAPPHSFSINEPARVVLDFPATRSGLSDRQQPINIGVAEKVSILESGDRTRVSVNLARLVPYAMRTEGNTVLLTLEAGSRAVTSAAQPVVAATPRAVKNIDFRRGTAGQAVISVKLSDPGITVNVREEGKQIVADFLGANLPRGQERRLDVTDFATPVTQVDALNQGNNARLSVQPIPPYTYLAYQADDTYTIEVKPFQEEKKDDELDPRKKKFTGDLLSLNFQDIEVRAVLQIIADFTGQNVVVSDTVKGNLTLRLQNVPWDQALDIILRTKGLTMRQNGNVIYIAPTEEVAAREKLELEARKTVTELEPLRSELIQVNYAKAKDLRTLLKGGSAGAGGGGGQKGETSLLSPRGQVSVDDRTNTLLVQDIPGKLSEIRSLVTRLDVPVRQVMIDSRVVIANDNFSKELGIKWGFAGVRTNGDRLTSVAGTAAGTNTIVTSAVDNILATGQPYPTAVPPLLERLGVNLGVTNPAGRLALAILGKDYLVDLELSALQAEGQGEILSNPRVVTTDRAEASIKQGFEVPYVTPGGGNGPDTVTFKEALLALIVTPQITPDDHIIMDLKVNKDEPDFTRTVLGNPPLRKREVRTQVLVNNGETVVLGGVFEQTTLNQLDKVPLLGDIPVLGRLFQRRRDADEKLELLIFVTPQIITEGIARR